MTSHIAAAPLRHHTVIKFVAGLHLFHGIKRTICIVFFGDFTVDVFGKMAAIKCLNVKFLSRIKPEAEGLC
jgi:hypothetical protein